MNISMPKRSETGMAQARPASLRKVRRKPSEKNGTLLDQEWFSYLIAFLAPFLSMLVIFAIKSIYPFGERSFLRTDLYHQYAPFFQEYKLKLSTFDNIMYTWNIGLGTNFMSIYAYYLSSPINLLLVFVHRTHVIEFITYGIVLRMALSSVTMTWYLNRHNGRSHLAAALFGIFYGMSGYMAAYSWNIMWLDCLFLFPLIMRGLEDLIIRGKGLLYCIALGLCIYSNYYISIMICISIVLLFAADLIILEPEDGGYVKRVLLFAVYSLLAGGLAGVMLLPEIAALSTTASGSVSFPRTMSSYFSILEMMSRHLILVACEIGLDHWPNIYCGVAVLLFVPLYVMSTKVPFREKIAMLILIVFFYLSFSLNILNFIWHGFHYPNSLPCRQSFVYVFLILSISYKGYLEVRRRTAKEIALAIVLAIAFVVLAEKINAEYMGTESLSSNNDQYFVWYSFYASIAFLIIYAILVKARATAGRFWRPLLFTIALISVFAESTINMAVTSVTTINRTNYVEKDQTVRDLRTQIDEKENGNFYRMERTSNRTKNDGAWFDYHSISIFSSMSYSDLTAFYKKIGMESSTNAYGSKGQTFPSLMLLGAKYSLSMNELTEDEYRTLAFSDNGVYIYENTYALPVGFAVYDTLESSWSTLDTNPAVNWNSLAQAVVGKDLYIEQFDIENNVSTKVTVTTSDSGYVAIYTNKAGADDVSVSYEGFSAKTFGDLNRSYFISLDYVEAGTAITLENKESGGKNITANAYVLDGDVLAELYEKLSENGLEVTSYDSTSITGTVTADAEQTMLFTVPFDKGWTAYVDGQPVETESYKAAFLSFKIPEGTHTVSIQYTPQGFRYGLMLSIISIILLVALELLRRVYAKQKAARAVRDSEENDDLWLSEEQTGIRSEMETSAISDDPSGAESLEDEDFEILEGLEDSETDDE